MTDIATVTTDEMVVMDTGTAEMIEETTETHATAMTGTDTETTGKFLLWQWYPEFKIFSFYSRSFTIFLFPTSKITSPVCLQIQISY